MSSIDTSRIAQASFLFFFFFLLLYVFLSVSISYLYIDQRDSGNLHAHVLCTKPSPANLGQITASL